MYISFFSYLKNDDRHHLRHILVNWHTILAFTEQPQTTQSTYAVAKLQRKMDNNDQNHIIKGLFATALTTQCNIT